MSANPQAEKLKQRSEFATERAVRLEPEETGDFSSFEDIQEYLKQIAEEQEREEEDPENSATQVDESYEQKVLGRSNVLEWVEEQKVIGPFSLDHMVGKGAIGIVYHAGYTEEGSVLTEGLPEEFALKFVRPRKRGHFEGQISTPHEDIRYSGSRIIGAIRHPNIVRVYKTGLIRSEKEVAYILMELVKGRNLESIMNHYGAFSQKKTIEILRQIAYGLGAMHCAGIVHRDIKPNNLVLDDKTGLVKISDFDLVQHEWDSISATIEGTPIYIAPEVYNAECHVHESDIYALGVTGYVMLMNESPFKECKNVVEVFEKLSSKGVPKVSRLRAGTELIELLAAMYHNDRDKRPDAPKVYRALDSMMKNG